jgi:hypothetical protein
MINRVRAAAACDSPRRAFLEDCEMSDGQVKGITSAKLAGQVKTQDPVRVLYGVHALEAGLAGRTVADVRQALRQAFNISPQAVAVVDGREVGESFILLAGQQLEFVRLAGEKG